MVDRESVSMTTGVFQILSGRTRGLETISLNWQTLGFFSFLFSFRDLNDFSIKTSKTIWGSKLSFLGITPPFKNLDPSLVLMAKIHCLKAFEGIYILKM